MIDPKKKEHLLRLYADGVKPRVAAALAGVTVGSAVGLYYRTREPREPRDRSRFYRHRKTVSLDDEMDRAIAERAAADGISTAEMIRQLIEWGLEA